jgi:hypothetical protein
MVSVFYVQYTGKGWLTYALFPLIVFAGVMAGMMVLGAAASRNLGAGTAAVVIAVAGAAVQWLVGRGLNGSAADDDLEGSEHTTLGVPMELLAPFYPAFGLVMLSFVVGQATSQIWGWLLFLGAAVPTWLLVRAARERRGLP